MTEQTEKHEDIMIRTDSFDVNSYSVDAKANLTLPNLFRWFQEAAYRHAEELEFGYSQLGSMEQFWVISRCLIRAVRYPEWGESVSVTTWPKGTSRLFALRDFLVHDAEGHDLFAATSSWLVLDAKTRRVKRLDSLFEGRPLPLGKHAISEESGKVPPPENPEKNAEFRVRYGDIDVNGHVNNTRYLEWVLDSFPMDFRKTQLLEELEINFLAETFPDETVGIHTAPAAAGTETERETYLHSVIRDEDGKEVFRARTVWRRL